MKKKHILIILILLLINQLTILNRNLEIGFTPVLVITFIFGLLCDAILIYIMFKQSEKDRIAKELEEIRHQSEREQAYYQEMENQRIEMAKLRHDYNNLITSVLGLIHMGREKEAEEMLDELMEQMEEMEEMEGKYNVEPID